MPKSIFAKIQKCVQRLYKKDKYLFECGVCERSLMFRLAYYLQKEFTGYSVDCEFNKLGFNENMTGNKMMFDPATNELKRIYVDIIIHKRNSNLTDNFICLELKRTRKDMESDTQRLKIMTSKNGFTYEAKNYLFNYDFGFFILLPKNEQNAEIHVFQDGKVKSINAAHITTTNVQIPAVAG